MKPRKDLHAVAPSPPLCSDFKHRVWLYEIPSLNLSSEMKFPNPRTQEEAKTSIAAQYSLPETDVRVQSHQARREFRQLARELGWQ